jgi:hypothetical protein
MPYISRYLYRNKFSIKFDAGSSLGSGGFGSSSSSSASSKDISQGYNTQKEHYHQVVSNRASRVDTQDKYKTEKWTK